MRALSLLLAVVSWFCSGLALLIGLLWGLGLKCDEACDPSRGWRGDPDAWQWDGIAGLGILAFLAGTAFFVLVWKRRPLLAACAMVAGFAAAAMVTGVFGTEWIDHLDRRNPAELLLMTASVFAPILAVLLTVPERDAT